MRILGPLPQNLMQLDFVFQVLEIVYFNFIHQGTLFKL